MINFKEYHAIKEAEDDQIDSMMAQIMPNIPEGEFRNTPEYTELMKFLRGKVAENIYDYTNEENREEIINGAIDIIKKMKPDKNGKFPIKKAIKNINDVIGAVQDKEDEPLDEPEEPVTKDKSKRKIIIRKKPTNQDTEETFENTEPELKDTNNATDSSNPKFLSPVERQLINFLHTDYPKTKQAHSDWINKNGIRDFFNSSDFVRNWGDGNKREIGEGGLERLLSTKKEGQEEEAEKFIAKLILFGSVIQLIKTKYRKTEVYNELSDKLNKKDAQLLAELNGISKDIKGIWAVTKFPEIKEFTLPAAMAFVKKYMTQKAQIRNSQENSKFLTAWQNFKDGKIDQLKGKSNEEALDQFGKDGVLPKNFNRQEFLYQAGGEEEDSKKETPPTSSSEKQTTPNNTTTEQKPEEEKQPEAKSSEVKATSTRENIPWELDSYIDKVDEIAQNAIDEITKKYASKKEIQESINRALKSVLQEALPLAAAAAGIGAAASGYARRTFNTKNADGSERKWATNLKDSIANQSIEQIKKWANEAKSTIEKEWRIQDDDYIATNNRKKDAKYKIKKALIDLNKKINDLNYKNYKKTSQNEIGLLGRAIGSGVKDTVSSAKKAITGSAYGRMAIDKGKTLFKQGKEAMEQMKINAETGRANQLSALMDNPKEFSVFSMTLQNAYEKAKKINSSLTPEQFVKNKSTPFVIQLNNPKIKTNNINDFINFFGQTGESFLTTVLKELAKDGKIDANDMENIKNSFDDNQQELNFGDNKDVNKAMAGRQQEVGEKAAEEKVNNTTTEQKPEEQMNENEFLSKFKSKFVTAYGNATSNQTIKAGDQKASDDFIKNFIKENNGPEDSIILAQNLFKEYEKAINVGSPPVKSNQDTPETQTTTTNNVPPAAGAAGAASVTTANVGTVFPPRALRKNILKRMM